MDILIKIVQFFLCFTILIGLHEFGHFIMARIFRIRVEKFYIFFDPWFSLFKFRRGDTEYGMGWIPLGGYVKIAGMIDESMDTEQMKQPEQPWEFRSKPAWQRFLVMIAGVVMNVVLAVVIYCGISYTWGESYISNEDMVWGYNFNEEAEELGFRDGDRLLSIDGEEIDNMALITTRLLITDSERAIEVLRDGAPHSFTIPFEQLVALRKSENLKSFCTPVIPFIVDSISYPEARERGLCVGDRVVGVGELMSDDATLLSAELRLHKSDSARLRLLRGEEQLELTLPVDSTGRIGILLKPLPIRTQEYTFWQSIPAGINRCGRVVSSYWEQLKLIVQPKTEMYKELGGFIAIGSIFSTEWNWLDFWVKTAFLSIILAIMNILPIPGLDGGHALFTLWEIITGRKVSERVLEIAQYIGLALLLALLLYANGNDIYRFFIR